MSKCYYCDYTSNSNITCPKCNTNLCIYCIRISMIHNDGQYLCPACNNDLHNYIIDFSSKYYKDEVIQVGNINSLNSRDACVICYDPFQEDEIIRCNTCHQPYCYDCFRRLIRSNPGHICAMCRQKLSITLIEECMEKEYVPKKKQCFGHSHGSNVIRFDINNTVIRCKNCEERFEYDTLISYFTAKYKQNKEYIPDCIHCHAIWGDNKVLFDTFGRDFCKGVLNLFDPYACKFCQERKELVHCQVCIDCLKQHFQSNENAIFDCKECHEVFTPKFMYDYFGLEYCRDVLKIEDPYACKSCHTRFYPKYTCRYCKTHICKVCERQHLEQAAKNQRNLDCINCHHIYDEFDLYDDLFENEKDYLKNVLHVDDPYECKLCKKDLYDTINSFHYNRYEKQFIRCKNCRKYFCYYCLLEYLRNIAKEYKNNTPDFHHISDGFYKCPCCNETLTNKFLYESFENYECHYDLYIANPNNKCIKCNQPNYHIFQCKECKKYNCLDCICEEQRKRILEHPEIKKYTYLQCIYCQNETIKVSKLYRYLSKEDCDNLLFESEDEYAERKILKHTKPCPNCGERIFKDFGCDHMWCPRCHTMFNWNDLRVCRTTTNSLYYQWLNQQGLTANYRQDNLNVNLIQNITSIFKMIN